MPERREFFIGTYSSDKGRGILPLTYLPREDRWILGDPVRDIKNASYAAYNAKHQLYYLVDEDEPGRIASYRCGPDGEWRQLSVEPSGGDAPCFVSTNAEASALAIANYKSGEVAIYRLSEATGLPVGTAIIQPNKGSGPNKERQEGPHAHCARFGLGFLYSTDLGTDEIIGRAYDAANHKAGQRFQAFRFPPGQGPRHILFHPTLQLAYVLTELGSEIFALTANADGTLCEFQRLSNLPADFTGGSLGGHIAFDMAGVRLYASNRGHDSISVYDVAENGSLRRLQIAPTHGDSPRHFAVIDDIRRVVVVHEKNNTVVILRLQSDGSIGDVCEMIVAPHPALVGVERMIQPG